MLNAKLGRRVLDLVLRRRGNEHNGMSFVEMRIDQRPGLRVQVRGQLALEHILGEPANRIVTNAAQRLRRIDE